MQVTARLCSADEKIFPADPPPAAAEPLYLLRGETGCAQLCLRADADADAEISVDGAPAALYEVRSVPVGHAISPSAVRCTVLAGGRPGEYPDLLTPTDGPVRLKKDENTAVFARIFTDGLSAGAHTAVFTVKTAAGKETLPLKVFVSGTALPAQTLIHTDWFHADCLATYYKVPVFSEEHWAIIDRFLKNATAYGVNCILTPLFTPPLDTKVGSERPTVQLVGVTKRGYRYFFEFSRLKRFIDMARANGVRYFELSHLFTQWGAKHAPKIGAQTAAGEKRIFGWETDSTARGYVSFLRQLAPALKAFTDAEGITDRCFVHCSDEPGLGDLRRYRKCAAVIRESFGCYRHIDALSDTAFYEKGLVETPVPEEGRIEAFRGRAPKLWTYYCCGQYNNELPNRFLCMPSARTRILGTLLYKYDCEGFLHWGYNFYYTQLSVRPVDPFAETDAGGAFPAGDAFIVYPGENGEPLTSLRQQAFYEGLQDLRALRAAEAKTSRGAVLALLEETLGDISFTSYPMDPAAFTAMRRALYALLG